MGGSKWQEDNARHEQAAERERLIAWLQAEARRILGRATFADAIETALEEAESYADYRERRQSAAKRVQIELDFSAYLAHNGYID